MRASALFRSRLKLSACQRRGSPYQTSAQVIDQVWVGRLHAAARKHTGLRSSCLASFELSRTKPPAYRAESGSALSEAIRGLRPRGVFSSPA
jgi:hypothetical protein